MYRWTVWATWIGCLRKTVRKDGVQENSWWGDSCSTNTCELYVWICICCYFSVFNKGVECCRHSFGASVSMTDWKVAPAIQACGRDNKFQNAKMICTPQTNLQFQHAPAWKRSRRLAQGCSAQYDGPELSVWASVYAAQGRALTSQGKSQPAYNLAWSAGLEQNRLGLFQFAARHLPACLVSIPCLHIHDSHVHPTRVSSKQTCHRVSETTSCTNKSNRSAWRMRGKIWFAYVDRYSSIA